MHAKLPKLALNQETLRNLTQSQKGKEFFASVPRFACNTQPLSCPECNPPAAGGM